MLCGNVGQAFTLLCLLVLAEGCRGGCLLNVGADWVQNLGQVF